MSKRTASDSLLREPKKRNTSTDFVNYQPATHPKIGKVFATEVGKRPVYQYFIESDRKYFPLQCMLDLGSTSFVISPEAAKAFSIPVVVRPRPLNAGDVSRSQLKMEGLFTVPLGGSFGNHRFYNEEDHAFEVIKTSGDYDALIPAWDLERHTAKGITTSHLHFPPSAKNISVRVDALRQSHQRHPGGELLRARHQYHASRCTSPSDRGFAVSSSDSARAFSDAPESTCSYGGAFRTLRDLTIRIVKFWSS